MATLAIQNIIKEVEKVPSENGTVDNCSKTNNETLVAMSSENVEASVIKFSSDDSGILCKNDSQTSSSISIKSVELNDGESKESQKTTMDKCSQNTETNNCSLKSSQTSSNKDDHLSVANISSSCTSRSQSVNNDDENSCSFVESTSTVQISQRPVNESEDESNHASSSRCFSKNSSPQKNSQNTISSKSSQSPCSNFTENSNSCSSIRRSVSRSPAKTSQSVSYKSDDDASRSSFRSSKKSTQEKCSQSVTSDMTEDNNSCSSIKSSSSRSTIKNSQPISDEHDNEPISRSSFTSTNNKNTPEKTSDEKGNKKKKYFNIIDSDFEDENTTLENLKADNDNNQPQQKVNISKKKNNRKLIDSDSDEEIISVNKTLKNNDDDSDSSSKKKESNIPKKPSKISSIIDSESESDGESRNYNGNENSKIIQKNNKLSLLVDSDSESDRDQTSEHIHKNYSDNEDDSEKLTKGKIKLAKKRTGSARASKDLAMHQIHSETQRLIRESQVSLPYHRPKQRTLEEFLNRKKTSTNLPKNVTNAERIKMFPELISKVVKEKEKEAEDFYQSSDSEEDDKNDTTMEVDQIDDDNKIEKNIQDNEDPDSIKIFFTQKLTQDDIQESHNKKEILLQRTVDFGATRKLFVDDAIEASAKAQIVEENLTIVESAIKNKDLSVSRKLFSDDTENMDVNEDTNNQNVSILEKKNEKEGKNSNENINSYKKITELENSSEDIELNMSETEHEFSECVKSDESNKNKEKDVESEMTTEASLISLKEKSTTNEIFTVNEIDQNKKTCNDNKENVKNMEDPIFKLTDGIKGDDEIIDPKMLSSKFFRAPDFDKSVEEETKTYKELSIKEKILSSASKLKPMIKSSPGCMIDLTNSGPIKEGASKLLNRFLTRHTPTHKATVEKVAEVKIMRMEGVGDEIKIIEEILPFKKTVLEDDKRERQPGDRLKLKKDLMLQIASAREKEWKHKEEAKYEEEEEEFKCRGDDFYEGLPDEEELLEDEESGESEPEEDDMPIIEKPRRKCEFGDEEAEESDVDADEKAEESDVDADEENEVNEENDIEEEENSESVEEESESEKEESQPSQNPKRLRRIISAFDDDDSSQSESNSNHNTNHKTFLERAKTDEDMFASQASSDYPNADIEVETIPPFQFRERCDSDSRSQVCKTPLPKSNNILSMISPVAQLTALNTSLESAKKSASRTNNFDLSQISSQNTPTDNGSRIQSNCNMEKMVSLQKKLFEDPPDSVNEYELLAICSGKFTDTQSSGAPAISTENGVTDSQLMEICSGAFDTPAFESKKPDDTVLIGDETSQDITLAIEDDEESKTSPSKRSSSLKRSDESMFSSDSSKTSKSSSIDKNTFKNPMDAWLKKADAKPTQLQTQHKEKEVTDSQLMDLCSGDFTSQPIDMKKLEENVESMNHDEVSQNFKLTVDDNSSSFLKEIMVDTKEQEAASLNTKIGMEQSKLPQAGMRIASSSEDEDSNKAKEKESKKKVFKKRKVAKLQLSDDENDDLKEFSDYEGSDIKEYDEEKFVDYDSEENEVIVVPKKEIKKVAKKFLENEAELSESDWDSADEDERGLDKLEYEEGDAEDIDEEKMKNELDRIHMKQVMDEDQRNVRMLQELLFDDGDLHSDGAGRERKFKWKNIDNIGTSDFEPNNADDPQVIDDEVDAAAEIQMRKMRYEKLKFQEEKQNICKVLDDDFGESSLSKSGVKIVSIRANKASFGENKMNKANSVDNSSNTVTKNIMKFTKKSAATSFPFSNMRGSFLARGEETLVRIAQNLPENEKVTVGSLRRKKFVFEHLSPSVSDAPKDDSEQENDNTPAKDKKGNARKRKIFSSQTPRSTKKVKVDDRAPGKKLF
ncbi:claspin isoform X3 [Phymastichus coffea]|uniref:claspin isoform X3 n=1 Tax=Phymastichus coffea TaxID=108790 RepID=UPI00273C6E34|nr:claspin isoform X3 [Phymastichus coffea]